jgi:hypothetical protein
MGWVSGVESQPDEFHGAPFDSAQGTPFIDFLRFQYVPKLTILIRPPAKVFYRSFNSRHFSHY